MSLSKFFVFLEQTNSRFDQNWETRKTRIFFSFSFPTFFSIQTGKIKKLTTHNKKNLDLIRITELRNNPIPNKNRFQNKHTIPKKIISLPRSNIFLNKCYQNKHILLDLPKITSTYAEIKEKHKCVGGVTFVLCYWRCRHCAGEEEMWEQEEKNTENSCSLMASFFLFCNQ